MTDAIGTDADEAMAGGGHPRREGRGMVASGAGLLLIKLLNAGLGFATVTLFARMLPPEQYGVYILVLTISQFLALPLQMGVPVLLTREIAVAEADGRPEIIKGLRAWSRRLLLFGTLALGLVVIGGYAIVLAAGWPILQQFTWPLILLMAALMPVMAEMKRVMGILNGYRRPAQSRMPDGIVRPVLLLVVGGLGLWLGQIAETGLLAVYLAAAFCAALFGWGLVRRVEGPKTDVAPEVRSQEWWAAVWPLTLFAAASTIMTFADILMLGILDTTESVAFYRVASQIAALGLLVQTAVNAVLSPRMAALHATGRLDRMQRLAVLGSRLVFAITLVFAGLLALLGRSVFALVLGAEYASVFGLCVVLTASVVISGFFGGTSMLLNMTKRERMSARYATSTAAANIALNIALIPVLGAMGAAISTVLTTGAMHWLAWNRLRRDLGFRTDAFARIGGAP